MAGRKTYILKSEIQRVKAKHPNFDLVLDAVEWSEDDDRVEGQELRFEKRTVSVPSTAMLDDDVVQLSNTNPVAAARQIIGDEAYAHLRAIGGSAAVFWQIMQDNNGGTSAGE